MHKLVHCPENKLTKCKVCNMLAYLLGYIYILPTLYHKQLRLFLSISYEHLFHQTQLKKNIHKQEIKQQTQTKNKPGVIVHLHFEDC